MMKKRLIRKLLGVSLAAVMAISSGLPAAAAETETYPVETMAEEKPFSPETESAKKESEPESGQESESAPKPGSTGTESAGTEAYKHGSTGTEPSGDGASLNRTAESGPEVADGSEADFPETEKSSAAPDQTSAAKAAEKETEPSNILRADNSSDIAQSQDSIPYLQVAIEAEDSFESGMKAKVHVLSEEDIRKEGIDWDNILLSSGNDLDSPRLAFRIGIERGDGSTFEGHMPMTVYVHMKDISLVRDTVLLTKQEDGSFRQTDFDILPADPEKNILPAACFKAKRAGTFLFAGQKSEDESSRQEADKEGSGKIPDTEADSEREPEDGTEQETEARLTAETESETDDGAETYMENETEQFTFPVSASSSDDYSITLKDDRTEYSPGELVTACVTPKEGAEIDSVTADYAGISVSSDSSNAVVYTGDSAGDIGLSVEDVPSSMGDVTPDKEDPAIQNAEEKTYALEDLSASAKQVSFRMPAARVILRAKAHTITGISGVSSISIYMAYETVKSGTQLLANYIKNGAVKTMSWVMKTASVWFGSEHSGTGTKEVEFKDASGNVIYTSIAYCMQPPYGSPNDNYDSLAKIGAGSTKKQRLYKIMYYGYRGPAWNVTVNGINLKQKMIDLGFRSKDGGFDGYSAYCVTHYLLSLAYDKSKWNYDNNGHPGPWGSKATAAYQTLLGLVDQLPLPGNSFSSTSVGSSPESGGVYSQPLTFQSAIDSDWAQFTLPGGFGMLNTSTGEYHAPASFSQNIRVGAGQTFRIINTTNSIGPMTFSPVTRFASRYEPYEIRQAHRQNTGFAYIAAAGHSISVNWVPGTGKVQILKSAVSTDFSEGNPNYSLGGAIFRLTGGGRTYDITCDENGVSPVTEVLIGTYKVEEIKNPNGYAKNKNIPDVTVSSANVQTVKIVRIKDREIRPRVTVRKKSSVPGFETGNRMYSLKGVTITLTGYGRTYTFVCDESGLTKTQEVAIGTYKVTESYPEGGPKGFLLNKNIPDFTVKQTSEEPQPVQECLVTDEPIAGKTDILLEKAISEKFSPYYKPEEHPLCGAEFTLDYYDEPDPAEGAAPLRTWVIKTAAGEDGKKYYAKLDKAHLVRGKLYQDGLVPLGCVIIRETKEPEGYVKNSTVWKLQLLQSGEQIEYKTAEDGERFADKAAETTAKNLPDGIIRAMEDLYITHPFAVKKADENTKASVRKVTFLLSGTSIYSKEVMMTVTTDSEGIASFGDLEAGTYTLEETDAPEEYIIHKGGWSVEVGIDGSLTVRDMASEDAAPISPAAVYGYPFLYTLENEPYHDVFFRKMSSYGDGISVEGARFRLTGKSDYGTEVEKTATSGPDGYTQFTELEPGNYRIQETDAPKDFVLDETIYPVRVNRDDTFTISGMSESPEIFGGKEIPVWHAYNKPVGGWITLLKFWSGNKRVDEHIRPEDVHLFISTKKPSRSTYGYALDYDANGGAYDGGATVNSVYYQGTMIVSGAYKEPKRTGYHLSDAAWLDENGKPYQLSGANNSVLPVDTDRKIFADWAPNTYTVKYEGNGADGGSTAKGSVLYGKEWNTAKCGFTKTGYSFAGWNTAPDGTGDSLYGEKSQGLYSLAGDLTLYAQWSVNSYTASFSGNGGSDGSSVTKTYGSPLGKLPGSSRNGYSFQGWYTEGSGGSLISEATKLTSDVTYYAHWNCLHSLGTNNKQTGNSGWYDGGDGRHYYTIYYDVYCNTCGAKTGTTTARAGGGTHYDNDGSHTCDVCGAATATAASKALIIYGAANANPGSSAAQKNANAFKSYTYWSDGSVSGVPDFPYRNSWKVAMGTYYLAGFSSDPGKKGNVPAPNYTSLQDAASKGYSGEIYAVYKGHWKKKDSWYISSGHYHVIGQKGTYLNG